MGDNYNRYMKDVRVVLLHTQKSWSGRIRLGLA